MDGIFCTWRQGCTNRCSLAAGLREKWRGNEEMRRKWRKNGEMERDWLSTFPHSLSISSLFLHFLILSPFPPSLSISYIKMRHILLQNVKYGTFVANVTKISTYALWGNNSGSNLLRGSSAIRAGLHTLAYSGILCRPAQLAELPRSKFDPELFPHSSYVKICETFATNVPYLTFCNIMWPILM